MTNIDELIHHHADHLINGAPHDKTLFNMTALYVDREILKRAYDHHEYITNGDYVAAVEAEIRDACRLTEDGDISTDALAMMLISDSVCDIVDILMSICPDLEDESDVLAIMSKRILKGVLNASALVQTNDDWHGSLVSDLFLSAHAFDEPDAVFPQNPIVPDEDEMLAVCRVSNNRLDFSDVANRLYNEHPVKVMQDLVASGEISPNGADKDPLDDYKPHRADVLRAAMTHVCGYCGLSDEDIDAITELCMDTDWYYRHKSANELDEQIGKAIEHAEQLIDLGMADESDIQRIHELTGLDADTIEELINIHRLED